MPTLQELKDKWFISESTIIIVDEKSLTLTDLGLNFRHPGTALGNHSDGNNITILGEGDVYMGVWYDLISRTDVSIVYNASWRIDNVLIEATDPTSTALDVLIKAALRPASVYQIADGNKFALISNINSNSYLNFRGVISLRDFRFPVNGSNHQKFMVAKTNKRVVDGVDFPPLAWALVGSIDINPSRLDDNEHSGNFEAITHDFGVLVEGPAVADIEKTFLERWNDSSRTRQWPFESIDPLQPVITYPVDTYIPVGSHSIQVLRTYGIGMYSYSWADQTGEGEFSIWASTLNAIVKAEKYIYIEDQTFLTFAWPPACDNTSNSLMRTTDLIFQLGEALKRGVRVGVILSKKTANPHERFQRHYSLDYLNKIANVNDSKFFCAYLYNGESVIYVHSKMFIVDDEFTLIGSANFDQRSMCHDGEIKLGIIDEKNLLVNNLRIKLYQEHSQQFTNTFDEPISAFDTLKSYVGSETGHLRNYDFSDLSQPYFHAPRVNTIFWPYAGPQNLR